MSRLLVWQFRISRTLGKVITRVAAALTLYRMPPFVSSSAIVVDGEKVLVVIDPIRREPVLPGGHLNWRESPADAVIREVREETGFVIRPGHLLGVYTGEELVGEEGIVRLVYESTIAGGALTSSHEGEATWMSVRELADSSTRDAPIMRTWLDGR